MAHGRLDTRSAGQLRNRLAEVRRANGFTQADLAAAAGVSRKTINTVERGIFVPSTVLALRLAQILDSRVETLFWLDSDATESI